MTAKRESSVFDLDAARAARQEAVGEGFQFKFGGKTYTCVPAKEWPIQVMSTLSTGDLVGALTLILGEKQSEDFLENKPTNGDVEALMEALSADVGVGSLGNS